LVETATIPRTKADAAMCLEDKQWRKNNLYTVVNEAGERVPYRQRQVQKTLDEARHGCDVILKSRQHGITTEACIDMLDDCMFIPDLQCGIVAHTKIDAQEIFQTKIKTPYEAMPEFLRKWNPAIKCDGGHLRLANGSSIRVAVSFRSATTHRLHISELGKICAKYPKRAIEIKTGTMPSVHPQLGGRITVESTAEGAAGLFYDLCTQSEAETAQAKAAGRKLNPRQYKFHFFAWWQDPKNRVEPLGITISDETGRYLDGLAVKAIELDAEQRAWYAITKDGSNGLGKEMKREHPSTVQEAFEQSVHGAVFGDELELMRNEGRIGFYPYDQRIKVYTFWDLGYRDATAVLFVQFIQDEIRIVECYHMVGRGAPYHAAQILGKDYGYDHDHLSHYGPHDVMNHEKGTGIVLKDTYGSLGVKFGVVDRPRRKVDGIQAIRDILNKVRINAKACPALVKALAFYRYEWDEDDVQFSKDPIDDWTNDAIDALQTMALQYRFGTIGGRRLGYPIALPVSGGDREERFQFSFDRRKGRRV